MTIVSVCSLFKMRLRMVKSPGNWFPSEKTGHWHFWLVGVQVRMLLCIFIVSFHLISCREWFQDLTFRSWWNCSGYTGVRFRIIIDHILNLFEQIQTKIQIHQGQIQSHLWSDVEFLWASTNINTNTLGVKLRIIFDHIVEFLWSNTSTNSNTLGSDSDPSTIILLNFSDQVPLYKIMQRNPSQDLDLGFEEQ